MNAAVFTNMGLNHVNMLARTHAIVRILVRLRVLGIKEWGLNAVFEFELDSDEALSAN